MSICIYHDKCIQSCCKIIMKKLVILCDYNFNINKSKYNRISKLKHLSDQMILYK